MLNGTQSHSHLCLWMVCGCENDSKTTTFGWVTRRRGAASFGYRAHICYVDNNAQCFFIHKTLFFIFLFRHYTNLHTHHSCMLVVFNYYSNNGSSTCQTTGNCTHRNSTQQMNHQQCTFVFLLESLVLLPWPLDTYYSAWIYVFFSLDRDGILQLAIHNLHVYIGCGLD